ncbi:NAD(P)H-binding protein [Paragemmobacter straminiformis]|uniref:NAD(P)H-binding protein n=1 Tax=Paragemmobacter straminiformis TaxID=2045119 RepID=A0A842I7B3_9RHOB|nr:NAD(P)H-binding protein [Gemmobacter straminiformis]MBC2835505.1 NAD(P)H-binding protein [Gemmobacter straminiformis]
MTIAITGSTGQLGRLALAAVAARGGRAIALARDPAKAAGLGAEARAFDYNDPATFGALGGVRTLVLISSSDFTDRVGQHRRVIDAAKAAGVGRVIYTSLLKADRSPMILAADHKATEGYLAASGLKTTLLRNGWYTENHTGSLGGAIAAGALIGSAGAGRFSAAARADYAEAIAVTALGDGHDGKVYELGGDAAYSLAEMAAEVSRQTGKAIGYNDLPPDVYAGILQSFGLPEGFATVLADSDVQAAQGALEDGSGTLSRLIGRPTTTLAAAVAAAL